MNSELKSGTKAQKAIYQSQSIEEYKNNPFIEAMGSIQTQDEIIDKLAVYPPYHKEERNLDPHHKVHLLTRLLRYFQPIPLHLEIETSVSRLLRVGYTHRNPFSSSYAHGFRENYENIKNKSLDYDLIQTGQTMNVIGVSGVGKTRTLQRIFGMLPQVISHVSYKDQPFNQYQVTYLKIETPFDGSVKSIIYDFLLQVDILLGTQYFNRYVNSRLSTSQLMPIMAQIAKSINLGVLMLDELQHLKGIKSSHSTQILNFFTALINTINIPLILIGTPKALDVLQSQFRQARRSTNIGNIYWDRLEKNGVWNLFIEGMWHYQWTDVETRLTDELSNVIYEESQGVTDVAIKLYMMTQLRAIKSKKQIITPELIHNVANEDLRLIQPMIRALKNQDITGLAKYDDIRLPNIEDLIEKEKIKTNEALLLNSIEKNTEERKANDNNVDKALDSLCLFGFNRESLLETIDALQLSGSETDSSSKIIYSIFQELYLLDDPQGSMLEDDLRNIAKAGEESSLSTYESLLNHGFIKEEYSLSDSL